MSTSTQGYNILGQKIKLTLRIVGNMGKMELSKSFSAATDKTPICYKYNLNIFSTPKNVLEGSSVFWKQSVIYCTPFREIKYNT